MNIPDVPKSGRQGDSIYYWRAGKQIRRRYVRPKDPKTPAQLRCRAAFGKAVNAWSHSQGMTQDDQRAWIAVAGKVRSRPRLAQSGPLTGQQYFISVNCPRIREGLPMLLRPPAERPLGPRPRRKSAQARTMLTSLAGRTITSLTIVPSRRGFIMYEPPVTATSSL